MLIIQGINKAFFFLMVTFAILVEPNSSWASTKKKNEVYSAAIAGVNEEETESFGKPEAVSPILKEAPSENIRESKPSKKVSLRDEVSQLEKRLNEVEKKQAGQTLVASVATKGPQKNFDEVPSDQAEAIVERLSLVEEILIKHNRAYDYRSHTQKELKTILSELNKELDGDESEGT